MYKNTKSFIGLVIISAEAVESAPGLFEPCSDVLVPRVTVSVSESAVRESPALKLRAYADEIIADCVKSWSGHGVSAFQEATVCLM